MTDPSQNPFQKYSTTLNVLLDDDPWIIDAWKLTASVEKIPLKTYSSPESLLEEIASFPSDTFFY